MPSKTAHRDMHIFSDWWQYRRQAAGARRYASTRLSEGCCDAHPVGLKFTRYLTLICTTGAMLPGLPIWTSPSVALPWLRQIIHVRDEALKMMFEGQPSCPGSLLACRRVGTWPWRCRFDPTILSSFSSCASDSTMHVATLPPSALALRDH